MALFTLRGAWDKVREDPILKFFVVGVTAYGMSTFEGPMLSLKNVNAISHYSDWTVAHVHIGALGWNGFHDFRYVVLACSQDSTRPNCSLPNWLQPTSGSVRLGIILYAVPMYWSAFQILFHDESFHS
jgi:cytochrome c oxidase cbb3-type subunit I/II